MKHVGEGLLSGFKEFIRPRPDPYLGLSPGNTQLWEINKVLQVWADFLGLTLKIYNETDTLFNNICLHKYACIMFLYKYVYKYKHYLQMKCTPELD